MNQPLASNPQPPPLPALPAGARPAGLLFYRCWCVLFVLIYLGVSVEEILVATGRIEPSLDLIESAVSYDNQQARDGIVAEKRNDAPGVAAFAGLVAAAYAFAAVVPRKPWGWVFGLVMICTTTFPFVITAAGTIPLVMFWVKPAMRAYFNKR